jgi:hypothetical protein
MKRRRNWQATCPKRYNPPYSQPRVDDLRAGIIVRCDQRRPGLPCHGYGRMSGAELTVPG